MTFKSQAQELIEASLIALAIFLLIVLFTYQYGEKTSAVKSTTETYILGETAFSSVLALYNSQLPLVKKFVLETAIDAIPQSELVNSENPKRVFYGTGIGRVNVSDLVVPVMNEYFGNRWILLIESPSQEVVGYGSYASNYEIKKNFPGISATVSNIKGKPVYVYSIPVPFPGLKTGKIIFLIEKPMEIS